MTYTLKISGIFLILIFLSFSSLSQDKIEVAGIVENFRTSQLLEADIEVVQGKDTIKTKSDISGKFGVKISPGISCELIARSDGYLAQWMEFTPKAGKDTSIIIQLIYARKGVKAGERLKGVLFGKKSAILKDTMVLFNPAKSLRRDFESNLIITGLSLKKESNYKLLAQKRAESVKKYLSSNGISEERITIYTGVLVDTGSGSEVKKEIIGVDLEVFP